MDEPAVGEVTVVNADAWTSRPEQLAQLLSGASQGRVIGDPEGREPDPHLMAAITNPDYWSTDARALADALVDLTVATVSGAMNEPGAAAAIPPGTVRLTLTVEEAAGTLGISRAFAYEAVKRGEIPSIRIGRRVLVPRAALERLLTGRGAAAAASEPTDAPPSGD